MYLYGLALIAYLCTAEATCGVEPSDACPDPDAASEADDVVHLQKSPKRVPTFVQEHEEHEVKKVAAATLASLRFETFEHRQVGNNITLSNGYKGSSYFTMSKGFELTYGDILSLCGDFYGKDELAGTISNGHTLAEREKRFSVGPWGCLDNDTEDPNRIFDLNSDVESTFATLDMPSGCASYLPLVAWNEDHFAAIQGYTASQQFGGLGSWEAYSAGHSVACKRAAHAKDDATLQKALMMNACASHYLSDMFAAGHLRTPRRMFGTVTSTLATAQGPWANSASKWMHDEDNRWGLNVTNNKGNTWRMYGDHCRNTKVNEPNRGVHGKTITASAEEVLQAWKSGDSSKCIKDAEVTDLVPNLTLVQQFTKAQAQGNGAPMFLPNKGTDGILRDTIARADWCDMSNYGNYAYWTTATASLNTCYEVDSWGLWLNPLSSKFVGVGTMCKLP